MSKAPDPHQREARFLDLVVTPLLRDSMLWPILGVFVGHLVVILSLALVVAVRDRRLPALLALALALFFTGAGVRTELRVRGRPAALTAILAVTWLLSVAAALAGHRFGIY